MEKKTLNVAFSTQKGGAGKTTLTVLVASYLHYVRGYNVAVIDCDFPQHSILEMRERDLQMIVEDEYYKLMAYKQFSSLGKKAYVVIESSPENAIEDAKRVMEELKPDFVFFDLPGTINNPAVVHALSIMNYIIAPISADRLVLESTLQYVITVSDTLITPRNAKITGDEKKEEINLNEIDANFVISSFKNKERRNNPSAIPRALVPEYEREQEVQVGEITESKQFDKKEEIQAVSREENKRKRSKTPDYESLFIQEAGITARTGKSVYIRKEHHEKMMKIVQVIGKNRISLFSYIDNVLSHHFATYQDEIIELYNKNNESIF